MESSEHVAAVKLLRLKESYRKGRPVTDTLREATELAESLFDRQKERSCSVLLAELTEFVIRMRLASAKTKREGEDIVKLSQILYELAVRQEATFSKAPIMLINAKLYEAVGLKAIGNQEEAIRVLRRGKKEMRWRFDLPEAWMIKLARQEALCLQDSVAFEKLLLSADGYARSMPLEFFRTVKRAFEFQVNQGLRGDEDRLFKLFCWAARRAEGLVSPLQKISALKNAAQYFGARGERERALNILRDTLSFARALGYEGQVLQLERLKLDVERGNVPRLRPFVLC